MAQGHRTTLAWLAAWVPWRRLARHMLSTTSPASQFAKQRQGRYVAGPVRATVGSLQFAQHPRRLLAGGMVAVDHHFAPQLAGTGELTEIEIGASELESFMGSLRGRIQQVTLHGAGVPGGHRARGRLGRTGRRDGGSYRRAR